MLYYRFLPVGLAGLAVTHLDPSSDGDTDILRPQHEALGTSCSHRGDVCPATGEPAFPLCAAGVSQLTFHMISVWRWTHSAHILPGVRLSVLRLRFLQVRWPPRRDMEQLTQSREIAEANRKTGFMSHVQLGKLTLSRVPHVQKWNHIVFFLHLPVFINRPAWCLGSMMLQSQNISDFLVPGMWSICSWRALPQYPRGVRPALLRAKSTFSCQKASWPS